MRYSIRGGRQTAALAAVLFAIAVAVNYAWELAQSPLYAGLGPFQDVLWHCFVASLGDGFLVLLIWGLGAAAFRRIDWFMRPGVRGYLFMSVTGLVIAGAVEWAALSVDRWSYASSMPQLGPLGLAPLVQMVILPPVVFAWTSTFSISRQYRDR